MINMEQKLKQGDIVELKSGGLQMTVETYPLPNGYPIPDGTFDNSVADCVWFDGHQLKRDTFPIDVLKVVKS